MPIQPSSKDIDPAQVVGYVKSLGFNIFVGNARTSSMVYWRKELGGDLKDFLMVAKSEGVRVIIVDWEVLEDDDIEDNIVPLVEEDIIEEEKRGRISAHNQRLESLKTNVGKTGYPAVSWLKDNTEYNYSQTTEWWDEFKGIEDAIEEET
jgi:hypothetical protein